MDGLAASIKQRAVGHRPECPATRLEAISRAVARTFAVDPGLMQARGRSSRPVTRARQTVFYLAHVALGLPLAEVARLTGRDLRTIASACRTIEDARALDQAFDAALSTFESWSSSSAEGA